MTRTILIAGGTGLIGARLTARLLERGHVVRHLSRSPAAAKVPTFHWDTDTGEIDEAALTNVDIVMNLAGAGIAEDRWTEDRKRVIIDSRVDTTRLLRTACQQLGVQPSAFVSAAAIGYYGDQDETVCTEATPAGEGFLSYSCVAWEEAIFEWTEVCRTVALRIGVVLSTRGGALPKMDMTLPYGFGSRFADGQMWYSWVHIDDVCGLFEHAIAQKAMSGVVNAVAPNPERQVDMMRTILQARSVRRPILPAPAFGLRLALGEMADTVLNSTRVSSDKAKALGYNFEYPDLLPALRQLYREEV